MEIHSVFFEASRVYYVLSLFTLSPHTHAHTHAHTRTHTHKGTQRRRQSCWSLPVNTNCRQSNNCRIIASLFVFSANMAHCNPSQPSHCHLSTISYSEALTGSRGKLKSCYVFGHDPAGLHKCLGKIYCRVSETMPQHPIECIHWGRWK